MLCWFIGLQWFTQHQHTIYTCIYFWWLISTNGYSPLFRRSIFPKVYCSEGSLRFIVPKKRFIVPKVYWSEGSFIRNRGSLLRRFIVPKVHCSEIEVNCSEGSFIPNRGSLLRRLIIPKVQYSEISHLSDRKMLICYDKYEMIKIFGTYRLLGQEMVHDMNQMTLFSRHRIRTLAVLRSSTLPLGHGGFPQYLVLRMDGEKNVAMTIKILWYPFSLLHWKTSMEGGGVNISVDIMIIPFKLS